MFKLVIFISIFSIVPFQHVNFKDFRSGCNLERTCRISLEYFSLLFRETHDITHVIMSQAEIIYFLYMQLGEFHR